MKEIPESTQAHSKEEHKGLNELALSVLEDLEKSTKNRAYDYFDHPIDSEEGEVHLRDYWRMVRKRLWLIISLVILVTGLVAFSMMRKPDTYEAQARIQVDIDNSGQTLSNSSKSNPIILNNPVNYPAYFNTQLKILSGPGLLRRVAKTLDLQHNPSFNAVEPKSSIVQRLMRMVGLGEKDKETQPANKQDEMPLVISLSTTESQSDLVEVTRFAPYIEALQANLKIEPVKEDSLTTKETYLIDIIFTNSDPQLAAKVVNTIGDIFVLSNLEKKTQFNASTGDFLQKRIVELQSQIRSGEERLSNYAKSHQILSLDASQNTVVDRLSGLNKQLLEAENDRKLAEAAYRAALAPGAAEALAQSSGNDNARQIIEIESKLVELRQKRAQLLVEYTDKYPEVKEIDEQIATLEKQHDHAREQAASVVVVSLHTRYRQALAREQSLRTAFDQQRGETLTQNEAAINYKIIQQEIETNKELLTNLLQRSKENDVVMAGAPNNISIIDYATVPHKPSGPRRVIAVAIAFFLSTVFGIALALFLDYLDDSVSSVEDVENKIHLPALAVIPYMGGMKRHRFLTLGETSIAKRGKDDGNKGLLITKDSRSPLAEAYRQLRTSILLSTPGRAPQTLLVTSSLPSEGKTTTTINTSLSLSQTGANVLIIDADLRRPRLHSIFNLRNDNGLSTILSSEMSDAESYAIIQKDKETGLYLLPSGPVPPNPAELLGSDQMRRLIDTLKLSFTHIVIDSPPIAQFTDGVLISTIVNGVLLVVNSGKSTLKIVRRSRKKLNDIGAKVFGVVLNNVNLEEQEGYSYYQNSYYENPKVVSQASFD